VDRAGRGWRGPRGSRLPLLQHRRSEVNGAAQRLRSPARPAGPPVQLALPHPRPGRRAVGGPAQPPRRPAMAPGRQSGPRPGRPGRGGRKSRALRPPPDPRRAFRHRLGAVGRQGQAAPLPEGVGEVRRVHPAGGPLGGGNPGVAADDGQGRAGPTGRKSGLRPDAVGEDRRVPAVHPLSDGRPHAGGPARAIARAGPGANAFRLLGVCSGAIRTAGETGSQRKGGSGLVRLVDGGERRFASGRGEGVDGAFRLGFGGSPVSSHPLVLHRPGRGTGDLRLRPPPAGGGVPPAPGPRGKGDGGPAAAVVRRLAGASLPLHPAPLRRSPPREGGPRPVPAGPGPGLRRGPGPASPRRAPPAPEGRPAGP
jgi:hypothetical protein